MTGMTSCPFCRHAYMEDREWFTTPAMLCCNVDVLCSLINPDKKHVASFVQGAMQEYGHCCRSFEPARFPVKVYPKSTEKMIRDGIWWAEVKPELPAEPVEPEPLAEPVEPEPSNHPQTPLEMWI